MAVENAFSGEGRQIASGAERQIASQKEEVPGLNLLTLSDLSQKTMTVADASSIQREPDFSKLNEKLMKYFDNKKKPDFEPLDIKLREHFDQKEKEQKATRERKRT